MSEYNDVFVAQGNTCAICKTANASKWCADHEHKYSDGSGPFRGVLCGNCNTILGMSRDNIDTLQAAINYLKAC